MIYTSEVQVPLKQARLLILQFLQDQDDSEEEEEE
jgi:hypothetical protein